VEREADDFDAEAVEVHLKNQKERSKPPSNSLPAAALQPMCWFFPPKATQRIGLLMANPPLPALPLARSDQACNLLALPFSKELIFLWQQIVRL